MTGRTLKLSKIHNIKVPVEREHGWKKYLRNNNWKVFQIGSTPGAHKHISSI
jgi:hypothetical protein